MFRKPVWWWWWRRRWLCWLWLYGLLPFNCSDISCFSWPYKSGPAIALCFAWQLKCCTNSSSRFLIFLLIVLYTLPYFPLPSVSHIFFMESKLYILCPKYFNFLTAFSMTNTNCCEYSIKIPDDGK
jgi:hypothetical protein